MRKGLSLLVGALVMACASDSGTGVDNKPAVQVRGIAYADGAPLVGASVSLRIQDTLWAILATVEGTTSAAGTFDLSVDLDTLLQYSNVTVRTIPAYGSGLGGRSTTFLIQHDPSGSVDTSDITLMVPRIELGIPEGPIHPLTAAQLAGSYDGRSVAPLNPSVGGAFWGFTLSVEGDSVVGRYDADFQASTTCGNGVGSVSGRVIADTLQLRMVSDPFVGDDIGPRVTRLDAVTYSASADTLILRYPEQPGPPTACTWGRPAPLRLIR